MLVVIWGYRAGGVLGGFDPRTSEKGRAGEIYLFFRFLRDLSVSCL